MTSWQDLLGQLALDRPSADAPFSAVPPWLYAAVQRTSREQEVRLMPWEMQHNQQFFRLRIHDQLKQRFDASGALLSADTNRYSSERYLYDLRPGGAMFHVAPATLLTSLLPDLAAQVGLRFPRAGDPRYPHLWMLVEAATPFAAIMDDLMEVYCTPEETAAFIAYIRRTGRAFVAAAEAGAPASAVDLSALPTEGSRFPGEHFRYYVWLLQCFVAHGHAQHPADPARRANTAAWTERFVEAVCVLARGYAVEHHAYLQAEGPGAFTTEDYLGWRTLTSDMEIAYAVVGLMLNLSIDRAPFEAHLRADVYKRTEVLTGVFNDLIFLNKDVLHYKHAARLTGLAPQAQRRVDLLKLRHEVTRGLISRDVMVQVVDDAIASVQRVHDACGDALLDSYALLCLMMAHACNVWQLTVARYAPYGDTAMVEPLRVRRAALG